MGEISGGVKVVGFISPTDTSDQYAVIDPIYGIDGWRNVGSLSDMYNIPNARRRMGMVVGVSGTPVTYYTLTGNTWTGAASDWTPFELGKPAGNNREVQFNDNDTFGSSTGFTFTNNNVLDVRGKAHFGTGQPTIFIGTGHTVEITATGGEAPLTLIGGSGGVEIWTDSTPTKAVWYGSAFPGIAADGDIHFATYNSAENNWKDRIVVNNSTGDVKIINGLTGTTITGTTFYGDGQYLTNLPKITGFTYQPSGAPSHSLFIYTNYNTGFSVDLSSLAADVTITGGTYNPSTGVIKFTSQGAPPFDVSGLTSGFTDTYVTSTSFNDTNGEVTTTTNTGSNTFTITGLTHGSGTDNRVVVWDGGGSTKKQKASSLITDNDTSVGIGTTSPSASYILDISGDTRIGIGTGDTTTFGNGIVFSFGDGAPKISGGSERIQIGVPNKSGTRTFIGTVGGNVITSGFTELEVGFGDLSQNGGTFNNTKLTGRVLSQSGDTTFNFLTVEPIYQTVGSPYSGTVRAFYYNPNVSTTFNGRQIAFENTRGDVLFNTTSGGVGIGTTGITSGNILDVVGNVDIQGKLKFFDGSTDNTFIRIGAGNLNVGNDNNNPPDGIFIGRGVATSINSGSTSGSLISIGLNSSSSITTGGRYSVHLGRNSGRGITTGTQNTFIGSGDNTDIPSSTSNSIHIIAGGGYENNVASQVLTGLTSQYAFIGGGFNSSSYVNNFYLGAGPYVSGTSSANLNLYAPSAIGSNVVGSNFEINAGRGSGDGKGGDIIFRTSTSGSTGTSIQTLSQRLKIGGQDGKITVDNLVGSGTRMVVADTNGVLSTQAISGGTIAGSGTSGRVAFWNGTSSLSSDQDIVWNNTDKRLGINTPSPSCRLEVTTDSGSTINAIRATQTNSSLGIDDYTASLAILNKSSTTNSYSLMSFQHTTSNIGIARIGSKLTSTSSNGSGDFVFQIKENGGFNDAIYIKSNGNIGIGNTDPNNKLVVSGSVKTTGVNIFENLSGATTRMVVADSTGQLSTQTIPTGGYSVVKVTGSTYTVSATTGELIILADAASNTITINLPTVVGNTAKYTIKKTDNTSNIVTVDANTSETIDDGTTAEIKVQYASITLITDNTEWYII